ncbi:MAG: hypothetical protein V4548_07240 [Bacteroidota bacterium]
MTLLTVIITSFSVVDKTFSEYVKLQKLERLALKQSIIGKTYQMDLSGIKTCNKTTIKYLGIVTTKKAKQYKIITSFFVYKTYVDVCHGSSSIKVYNIKNKYVGEYYVVYPESLPDTLINNQLLYLNNSNDCNLRKNRIINLNDGLPNSFFLPCSKNGGDIYNFSSKN